MNQTEKQELIESLNSIHKLLLNKRYKLATQHLGLNIGILERSINSEKKEDKILNERNSVDEATKSFCQCSMEGSEHWDEYFGKHCPHCGKVVAK